MDNGKWIMKYMNCRILILALMAASLCTVAAEPEYRVKSYPDGGVQYDGFFIGDNPVEITRYYPNGRIQSVQKFNADGSSSINMYSEGATPLAVGWYDNEKRRTGHWEFYVDGGNTIMKIDYKEGMKDGVTVLYFKDGAVMDSINYKADKLDGERTQFFQNGRKLAVINYKNGVPDGSYISYFDDGSIDRSGNYKDGLRDGVWLFYNADGSVDEYKFKNGKCRKYEDMLRKENRDSETDPHIPEPTIDNMM